MSCTQKYKTCTCTSKDEQAKVYSEILNELVEFNFYDFYLGENAETLSALRRRSRDTAVINNKKITLHNELYDNPNRFCTIYLDTILRPEIDAWDSLKSHSDTFCVELRELLGEFSKEGQDIVDSLNTLQTRYNANDFQLCTSRAKSIRDATANGKDCVIGRLALSKLYFNKGHTEGMLFYRFRCGELCGRSELVQFENRNGKWAIKKTFLLSVS
jgi:hypothetical protein